MQLDAQTGGGHGGLIRIEVESPVPGDQRVVVTFLEVGDLTLRQPGAHQAGIQDCGAVESRRRIVVTAKGQQHSPAPEPGLGESGIRSDGAIERDLRIALTARSKENIAVPGPGRREVRPDGERTVVRCRGVLEATEIEESVAAANPCFGGGRVAASMCGLRPPKLHRAGPTGSGRSSGRVPLPQDRAAA